MLTDEVLNTMMKVAGVMFVTALLFFAHVAEQQNPPKTREQIVAEQIAADRSACVGPDTLWDDGTYGWRNHCRRGADLQKVRKRLAGSGDRKWDECADGWNLMNMVGARSSISDLELMCGEPKK